jgi:hypothetical protein
MEAGHIAVGEQPESTTAGGARRKEHFEFGGSAPKPPGFSALSPGFNGSGPGLRPDPPNPGRWVGARGASPQSPILRPGGHSIAGPTTNQDAQVHHRQGKQRKIRHGVLT